MAKNRLDRAPAARCRRPDRMSTTSFYASPPTFLEMLLECANFVEAQRRDPLSTKADVLDSMERRLSLLVGKMVAHPACTSFAVYEAEA